MSERFEGSCHCKAVSWNFLGRVDSVTACNCTICSRLGALWIYGFDGKDFEVTGNTEFYTRQNAVIEFHFCPRCGCHTHYRVTRLDEHGRRKIAANIRSASNPELFSIMPIDHFDGLHTFDDLPRDGKTVADLWS